MADGLFSQRAFTAEQGRPFLVKELSYEKSIDENKCKNTCTWIAFMQLYLDVNNLQALQKLCSFGRRKRFR